MIETPLTSHFGCRIPVIAAPMFIVSTTQLVIEASKAGGIGSIPSLNYKTHSAFCEALEEISHTLTEPYSINLIAHRTNPRFEKDLQACLDFKVPLLITSLGSPKMAVEKAHKKNMRVYSDVINDKYAFKSIEAGVDGLIAVTAGAGGHAGTHSPYSFIPELVRKYKTSVVSAGALSTGSSLLSALALGASGASMGTRFIASQEANAEEKYKKAVVDSDVDDLFLTPRISGIPANVIRTKETAHLETPMGLKEKLYFWLKFNKNAGLMKKFQKALRPDQGWKNTWSAGESVSGIKSILPAAEIMTQIYEEYKVALEKLPKA